MKLLVAGKSGQVARSLAELAGTGDLKIVALGRPDLDITDPASVMRAIESERPDAVVNAAAYTAVDAAETDEDAAMALNRDGPMHLARATAEVGAPIVHISTDYVFGGDADGPYRETDETDPQGAYGRTKLAGEHAVAEANPAHIILRTAWVHSPFGKNFVRTMLRLAEERDEVRVVGDQHGNPTYAPDIADGIAAALRHAKEHAASRDWAGVHHMVSEGETTWAGLAEAVFAASAARGGPSAKVAAIPATEYPTPAKRPANSRLDTTRFRTTFGHTLPHWRDGVERCVERLLAAEVPA